MDFKLTSMSAVLERADGRLRSPEGGVRLWPTGFPLLDDAIGGGLRLHSVANHVPQFFARLMAVHGSNRVVVGRIDHRLFV